MNNEKDDGVSATYAWLGRAIRSGIPEVEAAAHTMMAYYQGAEFGPVDERTAFEAWAKDQGWDDVQLRKYITDGGYINPRVAHDWKVWQVARASLTPTTIVDLRKLDLIDYSKGVYCTNNTIYVALRPHIADALRGDTPTAPQAASQQAEQQANVPPPFAAPASLLNKDELAALRRFNECALDGEGYDVSKEMMQRLAEIGVVRRKAGAYYEHTEYGLAVLDGTHQTDIGTLVNSFLGWPLPASLHDDLGRIEKPIGTHLMNADEARAMFEFVLARRCRAQGGETNIESSEHAPQAASQQANFDWKQVVENVVGYHKQGIYDDKTAMSKLRRSLEDEADFTAATTASASEADIQAMAKSPHNICRQTEANLRAENARLHAIIDSRAPVQATHPEGYWQGGA